ncbi:SDR family oxidoreductase [Streptomyces sp. AK02-01A]|uniref:SDR family oxidoreductase n=1 Tax=Streptomyces sp. AK02-01A TaxID=3028648 RepID=UPI0029A76378|nr:SDR family oxidoreductase [Streptomyces sp. AK02-01A]MDX3855746.1 SDR family oxidoreductase [Streptomyces sp. AK02-01A]
MSDTRRRQVPIAVIGIGALLPGSPDAGEYWRTVVAGRDLITDVPAGRWLVEDYYDPDPTAPDKTYARRGAFLPDVGFDPLAFGTPPNTLSATDTAQLLALMVAEQVFADTGGLAGTDRDRVGVILGAAAMELMGHMGARIQRPVWLKALRENGIAEAEAQAVCDSITAHYTPWTESTFPGMLGNVVAGRISNRFDLHGTNHTTDAACASSFAALSTAVSELSLGRSDLVISGGVDTANDIGMFMCFSKTPALSPSGDCRPFSDAADGTMLGEGIAMYALKRLADAERDGDRVYAVIRGIGTSSDGKSTAIYAPLAEGQARALRRTYEEAGYGPGTVELMEGHGTGTAAGDAAEFAALRQVYDESDRKDRQWCAIGSVKSQIGHTKCAAGATGLLKAVLALHHKVLPPTIKVDRPNPALATGDSPFYVNTRTRPWVRSAGHPRRASVSSFGFGGSNFHVTLEEYTPSGQSAGRTAWRTRTAPTELVLFSGPSPDSLLEQKGDSGRSLAEIARESQARFRASDAARLAVVASDTDDLSEKVAQAAALIRRQPGRAFTTPTGVHYAAGPASVGRIAFLFPGQGAQYVGMGADVAMLSPAAQAIWDRLGSVELGDRPLHRLVFPPPVFSDAERAAQEALLTTAEYAQPALAVHSLALLDVVRGLGLEADCVAGHSFGELVALHAAGVLDAESLVRLGHRRGELMREAATTPGVMLAVTASLAQVEAVVTGSGPDVCVANHNSPSQVVVSGATEAVEAVERRLTADGITTRRLNTATAFHSPVVASASEPLFAFLSELAVEEPRIDVYGNADASTYPSSPGEIRRRIADHLASPVLFSDEIEAMYGAGVRTFVEVGAGATLTGLVGQTLGDREHLVVNLDRTGRNGITTLQDALGRLAVRGTELDYEDLWAPYAPPEPAAKESKPKMTVQLNGANYGQPYPPVGGAPALPPPNPPRQQPVSIPVADTSIPMTTAAPAAVTSVSPVVPGPVNAVSVPSAVPAPMAAVSVPSTADAGWFSMIESAQRHTAEAHAAVHRMLIDSHMAFLSMTETTFAAMLGAQSDGGAPAPTGLMPPAPAVLPTLPEVALPHEVPPPAAAPEVFPSPAPSVSPTPSSTPVTPSPPVAAPPESVPVGFEELLLSVVAERTGYPVEMLNVDMELESDLGVDSIKRVEILSAMRERVSDLPEGDVAELGKLRSLREIVDAFTTGTSTSPRPVQNTVAAPDTNTVAVPETPVARQDPAEQVVLSRLIVRALNAPAPGLAMAGLGEGPLAVIDGGSGTAELVAAKLTGHGIRATVVTSPAPDTRGVVHLGGLAEIDSPDEALELQRGAFRLARAVATRFAADGGVFVTVQDTGGDFGLDGRQADRSWLGGIAALARTAAKEWPAASVKAIDCERGGRDAGAVAEAIVGELLNGGPATEVGLRADGTRTTLSAVPAPSGPGSTANIGSDSVIVATGGARGVTAAALLDLARTHRPRIVLLGRTDPAAEPEGLATATDEVALTRTLAQRPGDTSPAAVAAEARGILAAREVRATLAALEGAGSQVRYVRVDVRDSVALTSVLDEVRREWGPVTGIVHGAGVLADKLIADKTDEQFDQVLATKAGGLRALLKATAADPLDTIVLFSSVASVFGNVGQSDYAMANEVLNQVASVERVRRPGCLVRSIAWGPWRGGMVTPALAEHFGRAGVALIPTWQGAAAFTAELGDPAADTRVVVAAGDGLGSTAGVTEPGKAEVRIHSRTHPYLAEHAIDGVPVLPVAMVLDWFTGAAKAWRPDADGVVLRDLRVFSKVALGQLDSQGHRLPLQGRPAMAGAPSDLEAELLGEDGRPHFRAVLGFEASAPSGESWDTPEGLVPLARDEIYDGRVLFHGPGFQALRSVHGICAEGAEATLTGLRQLGWSGDNWHLDSAVVDGGLQLALLWAEDVLGDASLPMAVAECRVHRGGPVTDTVRCVVRARKVHETGARCDLALIDHDGTPRVELIGVELVRRPS